MKESDIRPSNLFDEYLRLCSLDAEKCFSDDRVHIPCPACDSEHVHFVFNKNAFDYSECSQCNTLFQSPRPTLAEFEKFYMNSESSNYWAKEFFPQVAEPRRKLIFAPRATQLVEFCHNNHFKPLTLLDVGAGYGIFLEEWKKIQPHTKLYAIEPNHDLAKKCRESGIEVLECVLEKATWKDHADLVTCFEVIEHTHDPLLFVKGLYDLVKPGGKAIISALGSEGFDIQTLWEKSKSVFPPHHLNFISVKGFETLFKRSGFKHVSVVTPGKLDVDIVKNFIIQNSEEAEKLPRFIKTLYSRGDDVLQEFQKFLIKHQLSSHMWVIGEK